MKTGYIQLEMTIKEAERYVRFLAAEYKEHNNLDDVDSIVDITMKINEARHILAQEVEYQILEDLKKRL